MEKRFYERRAYESVDEKSLILGYVPKNDGKKNLVHKGLKKEGIVEKRFYERRAYESVDEKSLILGYVPKNVGKKEFGP